MQECFWRLTEEEESERDDWLRLKTQDAFLSLRGCADELKQIKMDGERKLRGLF